MPKVYRVTVDARSRRPSPPDEMAPTSQIAIAIPYTVYQDALGNWVGKCPSLNVWAQHDDETSTRIAMEEAILLFLRATSHVDGTWPEALHRMDLTLSDTVSRRPKDIRAEQLTIAQVIDRLMACDQNKPVYATDWDRKTGLMPLGGIDSYRGIYAELAIEPCHGGDPMLVQDLFEFLQQAVEGYTFQGWKGGEYTVGPDTPVWISESGRVSDRMVVAVEEVTDSVLIVTSLYQP